MPQDWTSFLVHRKRMRSRAVMMREKWSPKENVWSCRKAITFQAASKKEITDCESTVELVYVLSNRKAYSRWKLKKLRITSWSEPLQGSWQNPFQLSTIIPANSPLTKIYQVPGLDQNQNLSLPFGPAALGNLHLSSTCLKLFWTSPKFSQWSNKPQKLSTLLACQVSDQWKLLPQQKKIY